MSFFFLPIIFGVSQTLSQDDAGQQPRVCPRCNNVAVVMAKKTTYFELCCVPIFPLSSKHVWVCAICQWRVPLQQGWEPPFPNGMQGPFPGQLQQVQYPGQWAQSPPPGQWQQGPPPSQFQQGYNPGGVPPPPQVHSPGQFQQGYNPPPVPQAHPSNN